MFWGSVIFQDISVLGRIHWNTFFPPFSFSLLAHKSGIGTTTLMTYKRTWKAPERPRWWKFLGDLNCSSCKQFPCVPVSLFAQLVEHCTAIAEVMGSDCSFSDRFHIHSFLYWFKFAYVLTKWMKTLHLTRKRELSFRWLV